KANPGLAIRVYDDVYHVSMLTRDADYKWDFFGQAKLEYRTFLKNETEFVSCYDALKIILNRAYRLFYWDGGWLIFRMGMYQFNPYVQYYTTYDQNGENGVGTEILESYATVGKTELIRCINSDQIQSSRFARKSVKDSFAYEVPE